MVPLLSVFVFLKFIHCEIGQLIRFLNFINRQIISTKTMTLNTVQQDAHIERSD